MTARRTAATLGMAAGLVLLGPVAGTAWAEDAAPPSDGSTSSGSGGGTTGDPGTADPGTTDPGASDPAAEDPKPEDPTASDPSGEDPAPDEPTGEEPAGEEPPAEPEENVSDSPTDDTSGGGEPVDACGTPGPDGMDPCVLYATGGGLPEGAVQKDTTTTAGGGTLGAGAAQLPRTGDETVLLALAGLGLVVLGSASVAAGRPRRTS